MTGPVSDAGGRYAAFFHELDAWTEYWDLYHPETKGRFYFGDGGDEPGLLTRLLPRDRRPAVFGTWMNCALGLSDPEAFAAAVRVPDVAFALREMDGLLDRTFRARFAAPTGPAAQADYLEAVFRFATNTLPPATERDARVPDDDPRKRTAGHHTLDGDIMWFAWAMVLEGATLLGADDGQQARRTLMLAGVATGCAADFAWRGHRRTRAVYTRSDATVRLLRQRGLAWANDFGACATEVYALYRIREWGEEG